MKYLESITDFFKSPQWKMNLLLGAVAGLIPVVGPLVLAGWLITVFWARGEDEDPARMPSFDFQFFVKYLERGLWPFLVNLVASLALMPVMMILGLAMMFSVGGFDHHPRHEAIQAVSVLVIGASIILYFVAMVVFYLAIVPLTLRATITQNFAQAFHAGFVKSFIALMWKEMLVVWVFLIGVSIVMMIFTICTCYIGLFPSIPVVSFTWQHLQKQLYKIYVSRGGVPVPLSAKLMDTPPALPPNAGGAVAVTTRESDEPR